MFFFFIRCYLKTVAAVDVDADAVDDDGIVDDDDTSC